MRREARERDQEGLAAVRAGFRVYDANGDLVGTIETVERFRATMRVATNPFFEDALVIPLGLIANVNARELFVSSTRQELHGNATMSDDAGVSHAR